MLIRAPYGSIAPLPGPVHSCTQAPMMANLGSVPDPTRGWQGNHLPIDPRPLACVATIEPNSAYLSYHTAGMHSRESTFPSMSHFCRTSGIDRVVCTLQTLVVQCRVVWEVHKFLLRTYSEGKLPVGSFEVVLGVSGFVDVCSEQRHSS